MSISTTWNGLPTFAKGIIAVTGTLAVVAIGYGVYRTVRRNILLAKEKETQKDTDNEIEKMKKAGMKPTLTKVQASQYADQLKTAFDGYGSDNATIMRVMGQMKNDLDVLGLIQSFGIRKVSSGKFNPTPDLEGTLNQIISDECSEAEIKKINDLFASKKIQYRF